MQISQDCDFGGSVAFLATICGRSLEMETVSPFSYLSRTSANVQMEKWACSHLVDPPKKNLTPGRLSLSLWVTKRIWVASLA